MTDLAIVVLRGASDRTDTLRLPVPVPVLTVCYNVDLLNNVIQIIKCTCKNTARSSRSLCNFCYGDQQSNLTTKDEYM